MSTLALFRWTGDPEALLAAYDRELRHEAARDQPKRQLHVCARGDEGIVVVDLWESDEDLRRMLDDPAFRENLAAAGWPEGETMEVYRVHATIP